MKMKNGSTTTTKRLVRPVGDIMLDMEKLLFELGAEHDLQWHEILGLVHAWLNVHLPGQRETYDDESGTHPEYYYGPKRRV